MNQRYFLSSILVLISVAFHPHLGHTQNDVPSDIQKLEKFLKHLDEQYVEEVETKSIVEAGIRRMLEELDPHSVYLDKKAYEEANEPLKGKFKGIGVRFIMVEDTMTILDVIPGGSALASGILTGDRIVAINGDTIAGKGLSSADVSGKIKEMDADDVQLVVFRNSGVTSIELKRGEVEVSSIPAAFMLDNRTGYIRLDRFSSTSLKDFKDALDELEKERLKNLVLDLRGNGGGYLNVAIKIVDEFLEDRKLIVYTEGLHQSRKETFATSGGRFTDGDLYLIIDGSSASASEILAGAVQDHDRGLVVGRRSYGKGLVQRTVEFSDGSAMRLTISRYYTPTGRSIQRPYTDGLAEYRKEFNRRMNSGELYSADSMQINDSLVYYTPLRRKVYGGGGIVPDIFVPMDSTAYPESLRQMLRRGLMDAFALRLMVDGGEEINAEYRNATRFVQGFELQDEHFDKLLAFAGRRDINIEPEEVSNFKSEIASRLVPRLARFLYGYEAYFQALAVYDNDVQAVMHQIDQGTVKELGLR